MSRTRTIGLIALFIGLCLASAFGILLWLPFGKEGASWGDLPVFVSVVAAALALAAVWWWAVGRSWLKALAGWAVLALPLAAHGLTAAYIVHDRIQGARYAERMAITDYAEQPILWPGFDGPVGYRINITLSHPPGLNQLIAPPEIRMGPEVTVEYDKLYAILTSGAGFFKHRYATPDIGPLTLLKTVLFQRHFANPAVGDGVMRWSSHLRFDPGGTTALTYYLLPGTIDYLHGPAQICLMSNLTGIRQCDAEMTPDQGCRRAGNVLYEELDGTQGSSLSAQWVAPPAIDLGPLLTRHLRASSALEGNVEGWKTMHRRLSPSGLIQAGYEICPPRDDSHTRFRTCFCRPQ